MDTRQWLRDQGTFDKDREAPVYFAGRLAELDKILTRAAKGLSGNTIIVQGAPGAGKTSLLREAARRFEAAGGRALFYGSPWSKGAEGGVIQDIALAALDVEADVFATTRTSAVSARGTVGAVGGTVTKSAQSPPIAVPHWTDFARRFADRAPDCRPVLILADESQNFADDAGELVQALHTQAEFPITLACGGLSDTLNRLREIGISRVGGDSILRIGALTKEEATDAIQHAMSWSLEQCMAPRIRHTAAQVEHWAEFLANASLGWPQHLASYLVGAWRALAEAERLDLGAQSNLDAAVAYGDRLCAAYYEGRVAAAQTDPAVILAAHRALQNGPEEGDDLARVADAVDQAVTTLPRVRRELHRNRHPDGTLECYAKMLKAGVLEEAGDGERLRAPIPSLTAYLQDIVDRRRGVA